MSSAGFPGCRVEDLHVSASTFNNVGRDQLSTINIYQTEQRDLLALRPSRRDKHDVPICMGGTRETVFKQIHLWLNELDPDSVPNVMWIDGSPGVGKSCIASSLVSILADLRRLGSWFFFTRAEAELSDPAALWRTVASDLARFHLSMRKDIVEFLSRPGFRDTDILLHFKCMVEDVLINNQKELSSAPLVVVVDALDECGSDDSQSGSRRLLLDTLARWTRLPHQFKLIVTSRNERVPDFFHDPRLCYVITLKTGDSVSLETQNDIRFFFKQRFSEIRPKLGLPPSWPGDDALEKLTRRAAGLFIWANTAMTFMGENRDKPPQNLELVLDGELGEQNENLDSLYRHILVYSLPHLNDTTLFKMVVGIITVARAPLRRHDLEHLLRALGRWDEYDVNAILNNLSSIVELDDPLRLRHPSFAEFLTDSKRCSNQFLCIDRKEQQRNLALACLRVITSQLRFNICELESSHVRNIDVTSLHARIADKIPTHLSYSCRFWMDHAQHIPVDPVLLCIVRSFFQEHFLQWVEVLSLVGELSAAASALQSFVEWIQPHGTDLADFAKDALSFLSTFRYPISQSTPHIYISALPFSPTSSIVAQTYLPKFPHLLSVDIGRLNEWPATLTTFDGHTDDVMSVAYSPDGNRIVSGSLDKTVCVWDVETGEVVAGPFKGHTKGVTSVAYSPKGERIVSGSLDRTLRVWDAATGNVVAGPFNGHVNGVYSVGYSPDGKQIISGSKDRTIFVWNAESSEINARPLRGHVDDVCSVAYSPDGKYIASGSSDRTVRVWNAQTGEVIGRPFEGHDDEVLSIAYSADGKYIASGSWDRTIRVWDTKTGKMVAGPFKSDKGTMYGVVSVAFSRDGKRVASGSSDHNVRVWDVSAGEMVAGPFEGHTREVRSVAYSPDGNHIVSSSRDQTLCVWEVKSDEVIVSPFKGHSSGVTSISYSPDGKQIASGSDDRTVRVWDAKSGTMVLGPLEHADEVWAVAYSPDGSRIASASADHTVYAWDVNTGKAIAEPFKGHTKPVTSVGYSPDGKRIVSGSEDQTVLVWNAETGEVLAGPFEGHNDDVSFVAYSPDGKQIASSSYDDTVRIMNAETGDLVIEPLTDNTRGIWSIAYSPDGQLLATGSTDGTLRLWNVHTGAIIAGPFNGHKNRVQSVVFSPDGKFVASGSGDRTVCVWDATTGEMVGQPFEGHSDEVLAVTYSPNGDRIASSSLDRVVRVWDVSPIRSSTPSGQNPIDTSRMRHGWVIGEQSELLFWVPRHHRVGIWAPHNTAVMSRHTTRLSFDKFVHGTAWYQCMACGM